MTYQVGQGAPALIHMAAVATIVTSLVWLFSALAVSSNVWVDWGLELLLFMVSAVLVLATIVRGVWAIVARRQLHNRWLTWCGVTAPPICIAVMVVAATYDLAFRLRFAAGRDDLESYAESRLEGQATVDEGTHKRVGSFRIYHVRRIGECVYLRTGYDFLYYVGLVYCHPGSIPSQIMVREHVSGQWWRWAADSLDGGFG